MIKLVQHPPVHTAVFSVRGKMFTQDPEEPFVVFMRDGSVDTSFKNLTPGFINRIQRFGMQNNIPNDEWSLERIYFNVLQRLPLPLRSKYFRSESSFQTH